MPDANHQQVWLIATPVAQPHPIRLVPLHPNTWATPPTFGSVRITGGEGNWGGSADVTKNCYFYTQQ